MKSHAIILPLALLFSGCSLAPKYERPGTSTPSTWASPTDFSPSSSATTLEWRSFVTDAQLRRVIELALEHNRDLRQAILNIEAARATYRIQRADRLPGLNAQGSGRRERLPADLSTSGAASTQNTYQAEVGLAEFEIDLFARVRNLSESALQEYLATSFAARSVEISLVSEVIQSFASREGALRRLDLAQKTLDARLASLELTRLRRQGGTANALDYQEALGLTARSRGDLEAIKREVIEASNALSLLVGVLDLDKELPKQAIQTFVVVQGITPGVPSALLERRPDIIAAEHRLRARNADIGAARAAFFPRISLTGAFGTSSAELSGLFESGSRSWSFAPQVMLPIFAGGRNRANLDLATVRKEIAVVDYEHAIETAFTEVSNALTAIDALGREQTFRQEVADSSQEALRLSEARYRQGVDSHLRYLEAQRTSYEDMTTLIEVNTQRQISLAILFRALGGGWTAAGAPN